MNADILIKKEELIEECNDLRLPVSGNEDLKVLEFYVLAGHDEITEENSFNSSPSSYEEPLDEVNKIDYGTIGDKSWRIKYFLNKILFFI